jgi:hypothetical protein
MKIFNLFNNTAARSIFYIVFVGGLLSLSAIILMISWNSGIVNLFDVNPLTFLEAIGILALIYVIYFGIQFGKSSADVNLSYFSKTKSQAPDINSEVLSTETLNKLNNSEKEELREFVNRCCGYKNSSELSSKEVSYSNSPSKSDY